MNKLIVISTIMIILLTSCYSEADIMRNHVIKLGDGSAKYTAFIVEEFGWECVSTYHGGLFCMKKK